MAQARVIGPMQRGRIIQRILVDGWTAAEAAASFGVTERQVVRWIAAYRRYGMASLRDATAAEGWRRRLWATLARLFIGVHGGFNRAAPAPSGEQRRGDDRSRRR